MSKRIAEKAQKKESRERDQQPPESKRPRAKAKTVPTDGRPPEPAAPAQMPPAPPAQTDGADEVVVFAFRLSRAERDLIHAATGSAKASRFVRGLVLAGARGDRKEVDRILTEERNASA